MLILHLYIKSYAHKLHLVDNQLKLITSVLYTAIENQIRPGYVQLYIGCQEPLVVVNTFVTDSVFFTIVLISFQSFSLAFSSN